MSTPPENMPSEFQGYRRVACVPTNVIDHAHKDIDPPLPVQDEGTRIARIVMLFTLLAPLIASGIMLILVICWNLSIPHREGAHGIRFGVGFAPMLTFLIALPWALLTSAAYATIAVLSGWRNLLVALAIMLLPTLCFHWMSSGSAPFWRWPFDWQASIIALVALPTSICWYLTRRWHSPNT